MRCQIIQTALPVCDKFLRTSDIDERILTNHDFDLTALAPPLIRFRIHRLIIIRFRIHVKGKLTFLLQKSVSRQKWQAMQTCTCLRFWPDFISQYACCEINPQAPRSATFVDDLASADAERFEKNERKTLCKWLTHSHRVFLLPVHLA